MVRYFSSVKGKAFLRPGRTDMFIGCKRKPRVKGQPSGGFVWDVDAIVPITVAECNLNLKDYSGAVRRGSIKERTKADYETYLDGLKKAVEKAQADAKKAADAAAKKAKAAAKSDNQEEG